MAGFKIALFGIEGLYNYGCEAIVRGTELILHRKYPDAEIKYLSYRKKEDTKRLNGCNIIVEPVSYKFINRCINRMQKIIDIPNAKRLINIHVNWIDNFDVILSIGGDVYNLLSNERYPQKEYGNVRIKIGKKIKEKGKKLIIWGASIGPFEENPAAKKVFIDHFINDVDMITVRENNTSEYLLKNNVLSFKVFSDPAFAIDSPIKKRFEDKPLIGINLSPLSIRYCLNEDRNAVIDKQARLVEDIIKKYDADIVLLPHVVCDNVQDDDLSYLLEISNRIAYGKERVRIVTNDPGYFGIKQELVKCDLVIAARMHCAINAISCAVPTIFVGYSDKASGMCKYVYGNMDYYITLNDFMEDNSVIGKALDEKYHINEFLQNRTKALKESAFEAVSAIEQVM